MHASFIFTLTWRRRWMDGFVRHEAVYQTFQLWPFLSEGHFPRSLVVCSECFCSQTLQTCCYVIFIEKRLSWQLFQTSHTLFFNGTVMNFNIWHSKWSLYVWDVALGCSAFSLCITHSDLGVNFLAILNVFHLWIFLLIVEWWTLISSTWLLFTLLISVKAIGVYCFCIKYI